MNPPNGFDYEVALRMVDGKPRVMSMAVIPCTERAKFPFLVLAEFRYEANPSSGLPSAKELVRLTKKEERLEAVLQPGAIHLGSITGEGRLIVAFHSKIDQPSPLSVRLSLFRKEEIPLFCREDPAWVWFKAELELTPEELESSRNRNLLSLLKEKGDDPTISRPVDFAAFFPTEAGREGFIRDAIAVGYVVSDQERWTTDDPIEYWCEVVAETSIEPDAIAARCAYLRRLTDSHGGEFDGWATPVMTRR